MCSTLMPVVEVLAKTSLGLDLVLRGRAWVAVHHANVHACKSFESPRCGRTVLVLENAKQLYLKRERQLADLIEEEGAARWPASNMPASCRCDASVKAPRLWPKSSLSSKFSGNGAAVDGDERRHRVGCRAPMKRPRHQLFARRRFRPCTSAVVLKCCGHLAPWFGRSLLHRIRALREHVRPKTSRRLRNSPGGAAGCSRDEDCSRSSAFFSVRSTSSFLNGF